MTQNVKVLAVTGQAYVLAADGSLRALKVGDKIDPGANLQTTAGARVLVLTADGQLQALGSGEGALPDQAKAAPDDASAAVAGAAGMQASSPEAVIEASPTAHREAETAKAHRG